jgi:hypothetical protein
MAVTITARFADGLRLLSRRSRISLEGQSSKRRGVGIRCSVSGNVSISVLDRLLLR